MTGTDADAAFDAELAGLLARSTPTVATLARELVAMIRQIRPDFAARVRTGWGSVNFRHARAGFVCAVFPQAETVQLVFEHGRLLSSPLLEASPTARQVRWIVLRPGEPIPFDDIGILIAEAIALKA